MVEVLANPSLFSGVPLIIAISFGVLVALVVSGLAIRDRFSADLVIVSGLTAGSVAFFFSAIIMDIFSHSPAEDQTVAVHEYYPGISAIYEDGEPVEDIDRFLSRLSKDGDHLQVENVAVFFEDGTSYEDAYVVVEESERSNIKSVLSLAIKDEGVDTDIIHTKAQLVDIASEKNLAEVSEKRGTPAVGFTDEGELVDYRNGNASTVSNAGTEGVDDAEEKEQPEAVSAEDSVAEDQEDVPFWESSTGTVLKWVGTIIASVGLSVVFIWLAVKFTTKRTQKVRTKLKKKMKV